jgi:hypothetical protein
MFFAAREASGGPEEKNPLWRGESGNWGVAAIDVSKDASATTIAAPDRLSVERLPPAVHDVIDDQRPFRRIMRLVFR